MQKFSIFLLLVFAKAINASDEEAKPIIRRNNLRTREQVFHNGIFQLLSSKDTTKDANFKSRHFGMKVLPTATPSSNYLFLLFT